MHFSDKLDALLENKNIIVTAKQPVQTIPEWEPVHQAKSVKINVIKGQVTKVTKETKCAVILSDTQIGYRYVKGELIPFHDEKALDVAVQITNYLQPDRIIQVGDFLDLPATSKYVQEPSWATTTQTALDYGHSWLASLRELCPNSVIDIASGNHDNRLTNYILANASAAFGLRRACSDERAVLSLQNLLRLDDLNINFHEGYPNACRLYINDNLLILHGTVTRGGYFGTAKAILAGENVSVIHGHVHRSSSWYETRPVRNGTKTYMVATDGCLCRTDGMVPSTRAGINSDGSIPVSYENWDQGIGVVYYEEDGDQRFSHQHVAINQGKAIFDGKIFTTTR